MSKSQVEDQRTEPAAEVIAEAAGVPSDNVWQIGADGRMRRRKPGSPLELSDLFGASHDTALPVRDIRPSKVRQWGLK